MIITFSPPISIGGSATSNQAGGFRIEVCCRTKPVEGASQWTTTLLDFVRWMFNRGPTGAEPIGAVETTQDGVLTNVPSNPCPLESATVVPAPSSKRQ